MNDAQNNERSDVTIESEQSVLAALMSSGNAIDRVDFLLADHFDLKQHRQIYAAIRKVADRGDTPEQSIVYDAMHAAGHTDGGTRSYLLKIANSMASGANVKRYAHQVVNRWTLRNALGSALDLVEALKNPRAVEPVKILQKAIDELERLMPKAAKEHVELRQAAVAVVERIDAESSGLKTNVKRLSTGLRDLDAKLNGGMRPGQVIVVGGRPGSGKTAIALCIADAAQEQDAPALVFSQEMEAEELAERAVSRASKVPLDRIIDGTKFQDEDWARVTHGIQRIAECNVFIDDRPALTLTQIRAKAREIKRKHGLGLIVVDYLQLMTAIDGDNRVQQVGANSRGVKALAKELGVPIVLLSQLSRKVEERMDKRPLLADLRDSGEIEQDADVVLFLYRDEVYNPNTTTKGIAEIDVAKNRSGSTGIVAAHYAGEYTSFSDLAHGAWSGRSEPEAEKPRGFGRRAA